MQTGAHATLKRSPLDTDGTLASGSWLAGADSVCEATAMQDKLAYSLPGHFPQATQQTCHGRARTGERCTGWCTVLRHQQRRTGAETHW